MMVEIFEEDDRWRTALPNYEDLARKAIEKAGERLKSVKKFPNIILLNDEEIQKLNADFRNKNKPTNVLSFPAPQLPKEVENDHLGDIFIALETLQREAKDEKKLLAHHFQHLVIHGYLHLLGYDHESEEDANKMEQLEVELLKALNIPNPYLDDRGFQTHA